mmetsp:Transcript_7126/g.10615  ORF Transcript_7126/g.10615 Transcript_7126/m.10615 type:complete len:800 (-) Transcript_7126:162-2561(-)
MDTEMLKTLGLEHSVQRSTKGELAKEKLSDILQAMKDENNSRETRHAISEAFSLWACSNPAHGKPLSGHLKDMYATIYYLGSQPDDNIEGESSYNGKQEWANKLANILSTCCMFDSTQAFASTAAPGAYDLLEKFSALELTLEEKGVYVDEQASTERCEMLCTLLRVLPYSGSTTIPNAMHVLSTFMTGNYPKKLKDACKAAFTSMANVNKECMKDSGMDIMNIIASGDYDDLIFTFMSMPELYTNNPECIHRHLDKVFSLNWMHVASIVNNVASRDAKQLVPYISTVLQKITEAPAMGAISLGILKEIAKVAPEEIYPLIGDIVKAGKGINGASYAVAGCIANAGQAKNPPDAADKLLGYLIEVMKSCEAAYLPACIAELSNIKDYLSSTEALTPHMEYIISLKPASTVMVTAIEDFYAGRSLLSLETRVDSMEARIDALNTKVAESCANFEDVIAYVDANIADVKDFVGDIVKKLPSPKRLEVVGTLRKTLILHFECVHTGYEYPIISKEWSKWLKMGFSLAKAGKAVIDIGMGNPLGLLSTGVECVKGIYDAYKTSDDDEFNTYITNPFLTSTEQDQLIEKLREQGFFEKMAYDNQAPGWYLINPEEDGTPPGGEKGSVTKVSSKEGYGVGEAVASGIRALADNVDMPDVGGVVKVTKELKVAGVEVPTDAIASGVGGVVFNQVLDQVETIGSDEPGGDSMPAGSVMMSKVTTTEKQSATKPGSRAAAVRAGMVQSGTLNSEAAEARVQQAEDMVALQNKVGDLESKVSKLEKQMSEMQTAMANHQGSAGCQCTIC